MKVAFDILCLDEHDSPNLSELRDKSRKEINALENRRHFGLCGVIIPGATYPEINMEGRRIQTRFHGNGNFIPFHYVDILNSRGPYSSMGKDLAKRVSLLTLLNHFVGSAKFKLIGCFVDKQVLSLKYGVFVNRKLKNITKIKPNLHGPTSPRKINLYEIALKYILLDYHEYLVTRKMRGIIIAEARGEVEDKKMLNAFYQYQRSGAGSLSGKELRRYIVDLLIIRKSQNHLGLQIADLITYPAYDFFVPDHNKRNDHIISKEILTKKLLKIRVFP